MYIAWDCVSIFSSFFLFPLYLMNKQYIIIIWSVIINQSSLLRVNRQWIKLFPVRRNKKEKLVTIILSREWKHGIPVHVVDLFVSLSSRHGLAEGGWCKIEMSVNVRFLTNFRNYQHIYLYNENTSVALWVVIFIIVFILLFYELVNLKKAKWS